MPSRIQTLRRQAFERQGGRCFYCSVTMWLTSPSELASGAVAAAGYARLRCTAEHLVARSEGGGNSSENIVAACAHCNTTRHKKKRPPHPSEYREEVLACIRGWTSEWRRRIKRLGLIPHTRHPD